MAKNIESSLSIDHFRSIPFDRLRPSAFVDFLLFFANQKPAVRLLISSEKINEALRVWCNQTGYGFATDQDGYVCIAASFEYAEYVLNIDQQTEAHEADLGRALGYPDCCCERIALIGESNIDAHALTVESWTFVDDFRRINPTQYLHGLSLISHLPCSTHCEASLRIADLACKFVWEHASEPLLYPILSSSLVK